MTIHPLKWKSIVVMGGTTGLGLSASTAFVDAGARVVSVGRNPENVAKACEILNENGTALVGDATDSQTAAKAIELAVEKFGRFDGLYHVAGGSGRRHGDGPLHEITDEGWDFTLNLNLTSVFYSNRAAVQQFLKQKTGGSILNMGSALGSFHSPRYFASHAYAASKAAIVGYTRSIASYYAAHDIRVNVLAPALVQTPMSARASDDPTIQEFIKTKQPLDGGRNGLATDLDAAAIYFMSDGSRFTTGQLLHVDGGWSVSEGQSRGNA